VDISFDAIDLREASQIKNSRFCVADECVVIISILQRRWWPTMVLRFLVLCIVIGCSSSWNLPNKVSWTAKELKAATSLPMDSSFVGSTTTLQVDESPRIGVLLLNLGGPETGDDVEGKVTSKFE
jgi:hypothetical protein